jgi:predicted membrane protein
MITIFEVPGKRKSGQGTLAQSVNASGVIAGYYVDAASLFHGFVRSSNGTITTFEAPGAGRGALQGTAAYGINAEGNIAGGYTDASTVFHGFLRTP